MTNNTQTTNTQEVTVTTAEAFAGFGFEAIQQMTATQIDKQERVSIVVAARGHYAAGFTFITDRDDTKGNKGGIPDMPDLFPSLGLDMKPMSKLTPCKGNEAAIKATIAAIEIHFGAVYNETTGSYERPEDIMSLPKLTVYTNGNVADCLHNGWFKDWFRNGEKFSGKEFSHNEKLLWSRLADLYVAYFYALDIVNSSKLRIAFNKKTNRKVDHTENEALMEEVASLMWDMIPAIEDQEKFEEDKRLRIRSRA